jgi:nicotinamidase-related amidase
MSATDVLLKPEECVILLVDFQAGLGFGVESMPRQIVVNNAVALARTAAAFKVPVIASTSATRVYSGPLLPGLQEALPSVKAIERRSMNVWEDDTARNAVIATSRKRLIIAGFLTEACVSFPALSALKDGFEVFVVGDACGGLTPQSHEFALRRFGASRRSPDKLDTGSFGIPA